MVESTTPRIGLLWGLTDHDTVARRDHLRRAEDAGLDHVGFGDHVSFRDGSGVDGLLQAAMAVGATTHLQVSVGVYLLALRHPLVVARQIADLDAFDPGRLMLGVGVGGEDPREVANCGVEQRTRGRRTDESIAIVRDLLAGATVDHESEFFQLRSASIRPAPPTPPPILVGGRSEAASRRAGRLGDGYHGIWMSPSRYRAMLDDVAIHAADAGRASGPRTNALNMWCGIDADASRARGYVAESMGAFYGIPYERFERWSPAGPAEVIAEQVVAYVEAGCDVVNLITCAASPVAAVEATAEVRRLVLE